MDKETFECAWCKEAGLDPDEYTYPMDEAGGYDTTTDKKICENCADEARDSANFDI